MNPSGNIFHLVVWLCYGRVLEEVRRTFNKCGNYTDCWQYTVVQFTVDDSFGIMVLILLVYF